MKELEDYKSFPVFLRNFQTDFIGFAVVKLRVYDVFVNYLKRLSLVKQPMTDLCSGSGEPAITIFKNCDRFSELVLTDKYPRPLHFYDEKISYEAQSLDVVEMKFKSGAYHTLFNSFHHFNDANKLKVAKEIQASGSDAFIVEVLEPTFFCLLKVLMMTTVGTCLLTPLIKPFSFQRLFFTYIIPINIITITFDGVVSVFKSRSLKFYKMLFAGEEKTIRVFEIENALNRVVVIHIKPCK